AWARTPAEGCAGARELADALRRFVEAKPIRARRPTLGQRLRKWCRRHAGVVATACGALFVLLAVVAVGATVAALREQTLKVQAEERAQAEKEAREERDVTLYFQRI